MTQQQERQLSDWEDYLEARWPVHYVGTIIDAAWMPSSEFFAKDGAPSYRQDREESMFLVLSVKLEQCFEPVDYSGPDPREYYSVGKQSEWPTDGVKLLTNKKVNPNSKMAHLLERLKGTGGVPNPLLGQLQAKGTWRDASIWQGLRLEMRHEKIQGDQFTMDIAVPSLASVPVTAAAASVPVAGVQESGAAVDPPVGPAAPSAQGSYQSIADAKTAHGPYVLTTTGETVEVPVPMGLMEEIARVTAGVSDQQAILTHLNRADGPYRTNSALMIWAHQSKDFWALLADLQAQGAG